MKGKSAFETRRYYDYMPYRVLMCRMIEQAILNAQGRELTSLAPRGKAYVRAKEKASAIEYILSDGFEYDCEMAGLPDEFIRKARARITAQDSWQIPLEVSLEAVI